MPRTQLREGLAEGMSSLGDLGIMSTSGSHGAFQALSFAVM